MRTKIRFSIRKTIFKRDNYTCQKCKNKIAVNKKYAKKYNYKLGTIDHIIPIKKFDELLLKNLYLFKINKINREEYLQNYSNILNEQDSEKNLITLCINCNCKKSAKELEVLLNE